MGLSKKALILLILFSTSAVAQRSEGSVPPARTFAKGEMFAAKGQDSHPLFKWELRKVRSKKGDTFRSTWSAPNGTLYASEITELGRDGHLKRYEIDQFQTGESGAVEIKQKKAVFSWGTPSSMHTSEEDLSDDFVAPTTIPFLIQKKWKDLQLGREVKMHLAVLPWKRTIGFALKKISENRKAKEIELKLSPSSPILSFFSPNMGFTINTKSKMIVKFSGPSLAKGGSDGKWKDVDVHALYRYLQ